jgi:pyruvate ferredoxin oxidoreductase alpha subunit
MAQKIALSGNEAGAYAMKQIRPDVVAAFPITPQTEMMQKFSDYVADGDVDTEMILVESEHSAMSATIGAAAAGARSMTATSSAGLALMWEIVYIAASLRQPILMPVVNRALSGPINIHCDHSDTMGCRDSGWMQVYCENAQEAYDFMFIAMKTSEHADVRLPFMVCQDGFITSHSIDVVEIQEDKPMQDFIGEFKAEAPLLDLEHPVTYGPLDLFDYYFEHKRQQVEAMKNARKVFKDVCADYAKKFGKKYDVIEKYMLDDADTVIVTMSSTAGTTKEAVDKLRKQGKKAGLMKLRLFRPFPYEEVADALKGAKKIAVLDRAASFGADAPILVEVKASLFGNPGKLVQGYIFGLGGRDITIDEISNVYAELESLKESSHASRFINLRE